MKTALWACCVAMGEGLTALALAADRVGALKQQLDDPRFPLVTYRPGASGRPTPVIRGTGLRVQTVFVANQEWAMGAQEIAEEYGFLLDQAEQALAFAAAHQEERR